MSTIEIIQGIKNALEQEDFSEGRNQLLDCRTMLIDSGIKLSEAQIQELLSLVSTLFHRLKGEYINLILVRKNRTLIPILHNEYINRLATWTPERGSFNWITNSRSASITSAVKVTRAIHVTLY